MPTIDKEIEVNAPVDQVYHAWTQYERFPQFMEHVEQVTRTGPGTTHWVAKAAGQRIEWDARTVEEDRRRVAWTATGEGGQSGEVRFEPLGTGKTRLKVRMDYSLPSGVQEAAAHGLGIDSRAVGNDLESFKELIEGGRWS